MTETIDSDEFRYLVDKVYAEGRYGGSGSDEIAALIAHIDEKHAKDAQDAARLDFIAKEWFYINDSGEIAFRFNEAWHADRYPSLRAAIDAVMKEAQR